MGCSAGVSISAPVTVLPAGGWQGRHESHGHIAAEYVLRDCSMLATRGRAGGKLVVIRRAIHSAVTLAAPRFLSACAKESTLDPETHKSSTIRICLPPMSCESLTLNLRGSKARPGRWAWDALRWRIGGVGGKAPRIIWCKGWACDPGRPGGRREHWPIDLGMAMDSLSSQCDATPLRRVESSKY